MKILSHVALDKIPTQEDWQKAEAMLLAEISLSKNQPNAALKVGFSEFVICSFFLLEKIGVKALVNAKDVMNCMEVLYEKNKLFYPSDIFRGAWESIEVGGKEYCGSTAKKFFNYLKETGLVRSVHGREDVLIFCTSNYASEDAKKCFHQDLETACGFFRKPENKKYLTQISFLAKDLLIAMRKGEVGNGW